MYVNVPFCSNNKMRNTSFIEASTTQINIYNNTVGFLIKMYSYCITLPTYIQVSSWPGKQVHISVELFDETNQSASEFLQLEPANNNQVNINVIIIICLGSLYLYLYSK